MSLCRDTHWLPDVLLRMKSAFRVLSIRAPLLKYHSFVPPIPFDRAWAVFLIDPYVPFCNYQPHLSKNCIWENSRKQDLSRVQVSISRHERDFELVVVAHVQSVLAIFAQSMRYSTSYSFTLHHVNNSTGVNWDSTSLCSGLRHRRGISSIRVTKAFCHRHHLQALAYSKSLAIEKLINSKRNLTLRPFDHRR